MRPLIDIEKQKRSLSRQVMHEIEKMIARDKLQPGDPLPSESQIAEQLQVSKSSVREAIKMLEALGIVQIKRGLCTEISKNPEQGFANVILSHFHRSNATAMQLKEFRRMFEVAYTSLAVENATEEDFVAIQRAISDFAQHLAGDELTVEDDISFHNAVVRATHNPFVISLGIALNELFKDSIDSSISTNPQYALQDHENIFEAIKGANPQAAAQAIEKSITLWANTLEEAPGEETGDDK